MAIVISGTGIDMGGNPVSNASQIEVQENQVSPFSGFKNYIINGNFDVWQYKDAGLTYPQTSSAYGSDDRYKNIHNGSTKIHSQVATTDTERALFNASFFSRTVVTSVAGANNYVIKQQPIENVTKLAGKTVTLSFLAKADSNKNIAIEFSQYFGTGGTPSATLEGIGSQIVSLTSTWQKKTITLTIPNIVGKTLGTDGVHTTALWLIIWFDAGSTYNTRSASLGQQNGTFDIAQVQLEEGSVATPFENRPYGLELSLCQRYYQTNLRSGYTYVLSGTTNAWRTTIPLLQPMRMAPTSFGFNGAIIFQGNTGGNTLGTIGTTYNQINCIQFDGSFTANSGNNTGTEPMVANGGYFWASAEL